MSIGGITNGNVLEIAPPLNPCLPPYLADNTGKHDARDALQNCFNDAASMGRDVTIPPGTFMIGTTAFGTTVTFKAGVVYTGAGKGKCIFMLQSGLDQSMANAVDLTQTEIGATDFITITGITFDGNMSGNPGWAPVGNANYGLGVKSANVVVDNCEARYVTANGMGVPVDAISATFTRNWSHDNGKKGFHSGNVSDITIQNNFFYDNGIDAGIGCHQGIFNTVITDNHCWSNGTYGIFVGDSEGTTTSNSRRVTIADNVCHDNTIVGIYATCSDQTYTALSAEMSITGNQCHDNGGQGILAESLRNLIISSNNVSGNGTWGINIFDCDNVVAKDNTVLNNCQTNPSNPAGILFTNGPQSFSSKVTNTNCIVKNNVIGDNQTVATQTYGIVIPTGDTGHIIAENIITVSPGTGIYGVRNFSGTSGGHQIWGNVTTLAVDNQQFTVSKLTVTAATTHGVVSQTLAANGAITCNAASADIQRITLQANLTSLTVNNAAAGQFVTVEMIQDSVGGRSYVWASNMRFANGSAPNDTTANTKTIVRFLQDGASSHLEEISRSVAIPLT